MKHHRRASLARIAHCMWIVGMAAAAQPLLAQPAATQGAQVWITTSDHRKAIAPQPDARFGTADAGAVHIEVSPEIRHQAIVGFGASITDASAWLIQHRMNPKQRDALMRELFGREGDGIGLSFSRLTIGASDFSRHHYSLDDTPDNRPDPELKHFSIAPNRDDVIPVARAALSINPELKIMASPWSAPAWMKTSNSLIQGTLRPEYYGAYARYFVKYIDAYAAEGIPIFALTVQNEPDYEPKDYPGMRLNAPARARFIGDHLGPLLASRKDAPQIFDWDHNWDKPQEPLGVLADAAAHRHVSAVAWHCYGGEVEAQTPVRDAYPDKDVYMTECSGGSWEPVISGGLTLQARQQIIQATRHWARGVLFWNLALDQNNGPNKGGCYTCRGVVTINSRDGSVTRTDEYYALAHASRFVRQGARRIDSSQTDGGIDNVAFRNEDDGSRVLIVTNSEARDQRISVTEGERQFSYTLPAKSLATFVWKGDH